MFVFCKQKTAYEMRISDWSSDVCSSDLTCPDPCPLRTPFAHVRRAFRVLLGAEGKREIIQLFQLYDNSAQGARNQHPGGWIKRPVFLAIEHGLDRAGDLLAKIHAPLGEGRSEESRVGKEDVRRGRTRG